MIMGGLQIPRWLGSDPLSAWWLGAARRRSGGGRGGGWGLRLAAVAGCGAADRSVGSASARAAAPGSLVVVPLWVPFMGGSRPARRRSEGGRGGGWGLRLVAVATSCGADGTISGDGTIGFFILSHFFLLFTLTFELGLINSSVVILSL